MLKYLNTPFDMHDVDIASAYDEVPFWSFAFGKLILENIKLKRGMTALDIGFGTGFPLLELSQRLGRSSTVYGIDMWKAGSQRARFKAKTLGIENVVFVDGDGAAMDFENEKFDLIVSNVGINNFDDPAKVLSECYRVAKNGAQLAFTTNPNGHMGEFYEVFAQTMIEQNLGEFEGKLKTHQEGRLATTTIEQMLEKAGLETTNIIEDSFSWRFVDGSSFLNHHMIMRAFVGAWKEIIPPECHESFFQKLEAKLNENASRQGQFRITVPIVYIEATK